MKREQLLSTLIVFVLLFTAALSPVAVSAQGDTTGVTATTTNGLNVRANASTNAALVGGLTPNTTVEVLMQHTNDDGELWLLIPFSGGDAWIAGWLVTIEGDLDSVPVWSASLASADSSSPRPQESPIAPTPDVPPIQEDEGYGSDFAAYRAERWIAFDKGREDETSAVPRIISSQMIRRLPENIEALLLDEVDFVTDEIERGLDSGFCVNGICYLSTVGNSENVGSPSPVSGEAVDFFLRLRADMAVRAAQQQGIELSYEQAREILENGETFDFIGTVKSVPAGQLSAVANGGGQILNAEFNPNLPEHGGNTVYFIAMRAGFNWDREDEWEDRLPRARGLSINQINLQAVISTLSNGDIVVSMYGDSTEDSMNLPPGSFNQTFISIIKTMFNNERMHENGDRSTFDYQLPEDFTAIMNIGPWAGLQGDTVESYDLGTSVRAIEFVKR